MVKRMLIDATHPEETRVAVVDGNRLEEFDYESIYRKQLKGNIYLAKVTRVEPSLQAAFVNYGGNRHGFLPFSEIHPDYFRIPVADKEKLMAEQEELYRQQEELEKEIEAELDKENIEQEQELEDSSENIDVVSDVNEDLVDVADQIEENLKEMESVCEDEVKEEIKEIELEEVEEAEAEADNTEKEALSSGYDIDADNIEATEINEEPNEELSEEKKSEDESDDNKGKRRGRGRWRNNRYRGGKYRRSSARNNSNSKEDNGGRSRRPSLRHNYKIQEVIKRGQIMLVQVSKEERGNKGAAVTTYLSLPGRYCVLMPNSPRGGGISRKIDNFKDRKRMRDLLKDLEISKGMSVIVRTAGVSRTKVEIKRDLDYLTRLWNNIRELTLESTAPAVVYEEGSLTKKSIRDIYSRDIEEILVAGEAGYKETKKFMKMLIPSHARKVKEYKDDKIPLFHRYQVESQINEIGEMNVQLPSGGYLVINPTEALVSIDVNSGRATKERHIEETALKTNLEAAVEVARQLRLRDLGGLVVIDFIDMEDRRNNAKVERKMKEALSTERARIQVGRISQFGLMELSRQRLNPSLTEAQFEVCAHCKGNGTIRSVDSTAITILRNIEEEGIRNRSDIIEVKACPDVALYLLNQKRNMLVNIESRYGLRISVNADNSLSQAEFNIEGSKSQIIDDNIAGNSEENQDSDDERKEKKGNRRRGRRGGRKNNNDEGLSQKNSLDAVETDKKNEEIIEDSSEVIEKPKKNRRKSTKYKEKDEISEIDNQIVKDDANLANTDDVKSKNKSFTKKVDKVKNIEKEDIVDKKKKKVTDDEIMPVPVPSNDTESQIQENIAAREAEKINEAPKKKKKGWWNLGK